jgi:hypothetical protein
MLCVDTNPRRHSATRGADDNVDVLIQRRERLQKSFEGYAREL